MSQAMMLRDAASGGRLHHAWLIAGPEGVGKATLGVRFLRWLLAGRPVAGYRVAWLRVTADRTAP
jgi:DNA polymerase-3 subunit delta'